MTACPRVLWLTADCAPDHWSGIGVAVARQHRALREAGVDVQLLVARPARSRGPAPAPDITWLDRDAPFPLAPEQFEWVHLHSLSLGALALELQRRYGLRLVCTVHGIVDQEPLERVTPHERRTWSELQRHLWRVAERVVFLSPAEARAGCSLDPRVAAKAVVIPHGLAVREPAGRSHPDAPMLFVGRYARSKGLELLEQIVPELIERHRGGFTFIGGHGDQRGHAIVERLTHRFPRECRNLGWLDAEQLELHLARASLVLVPSSYEPFGLVALEAMSLGTPVLAADVGGLRSIVSDDSGGRLLSTRAPEAWIEHAIELTTDAELHARLRERGPAHVRRHFCLATSATRLVHEVYATPTTPATATEHDCTATR